MRPSKAHFVTSCQQLLALGAVLAVLTPAASVVSLDVVETPGSADAPGAVAPPSDPGPTPAERRRSTARVPVAPVEAQVEEVSLTRDVRRPAPDDGARPDGAPEPRTTVRSDPQPVTGYGAVGVTWSHGEEVEDDRITLEVRTETDGRWSGWSDLEYHDEHQPDAVSDEAARTRPGTDPLFVGEVDRVQVRAVAVDGLPEDMSLAVVGPGTPTRTERQEAAVPGTTAGATADGVEGGDALALQAASVGAPRPEIFTRRQWGADERLRSGSPSYGSISAGFVHHTVNSNTYDRGDVEGMLRSIYAYHTRSRGWSDIGYNFLVDKFGRIWEGRYGGVARPVIGAHTLNYNSDSFAMSAIGNFDTAQPPQAMLEAYGDLFAWKLGLAGIDPTDMSQNVAGDTFAAINGHRDAGSTACPGRYLYAQIPAIRRLAAKASEGEPEPPEPEQPKPVVLGQVDSDLAATPHPDLVVRRESDGRGFVLPTGGLGKLVAPATVGRGSWTEREPLLTPDLTGDGVADLVTRDVEGRVEVRPGPASEGYGEVARSVHRFRGHDLVASPGDLTGDGLADLVARGDGRLVVFVNNGRGGFRPSPSEVSLRGHRQLVGAGDVTGDGRADLWARDRRGRVWLHRGLREARFGDREAVTLPTGPDGAALTGPTGLAGGADWTGDRLPDLLVTLADGAVVALPSRGDGTLARARQPLATVAGLVPAGVGTLDDDRAPDLLGVSTEGALVLLRNRGTFDLGRPLDTGQDLSRGNLLLNAGDFDGDGHGDVVMRRKVGSMWLYRGRGTGRLADPTWIGSRRDFKGVGGLRVVPDVTGDKRPDVVGTVGQAQRVWAGNGATRLGKAEAIEVAAPTTPLPSRSAYDWKIRTSDLRGEGLADLVVRDGDGYVYRVNGTRDGYGDPSYLGEAGGYDLGG